MSRNEKNNPSERDPRRVDPPDDDVRGDDPSDRELSDGDKSSRRGSEIPEDLRASGPADPGGRPARGKPPQRPQEFLEADEAPEEIQESGILCKPPRAAGDAAGGGLLESTAPLPIQRAADATEVLTSPPQGKGAPQDEDDGPGELLDLVFKTCPMCHSSFGGEIQACPSDGTPLREHSMMERNTLLLDAAGLRAHTFELRKFCPKCKVHLPLHSRTCSKCQGPLVIPTAGATSALRTSVQAKDVVVADKYRLLSEIGAGGFGSVYLAKHESLGKRFALKMLRDQLSDVSNFRDRFHEEALKLSRLDDESIVKVIDFGEWKDSQYMVTEYVEGQDLGALIYEGRMPILRAARIMKQVAGALAEAHAKSIVHLDLKPANILVSSKRGRDLVKVIDFGIAEMFSQRKQRRQKNISGTPTYMAPEQWRREPLDPRTDIYSFGVILYECLAGRPPFRHGSIKALEKAHCRSAPPSLRKLRPDVPAELEKLTLRCLEKDTTRRFESADALERALDLFTRRTENVWLRRLKLAGIAVLALAVLAGASWAIREARRDKEPPQWVSWDATSSSLKLVKTGEDGARKDYRTTETRVEVKFEAKDNAGVDRIEVEGLGGPRPFPGNLARFEVEEPPGVTSTVTAVAFDASGNQSERVQLVIKRIAAALGPLHFEKIPRSTKEKSVDLVVDEIQNVKARVTCRNEKKLLLDIVAWRDDEGTCHVSGPGAERQSKPEPGQPWTFHIPLERGENSIEVRKKDLVSDEETDIQGGRLIVHHRAEPLPVEVHVPGERETVQKVEGTEEWLTAGPQIELEVTVPDAGNRLADGAVLTWNSNSRDGFGKPWAPEEIKAGTKVIQVHLEEGKNEIAIEPLEDCYGNTSERKLLVVHKDETPPEIVVLRKNVEYHQRDLLPSVEFTLSDEHVEATEDAFSLFEEEAGKRVAPAAIRFENIKEKLWKLQFLDGDLVEKDGARSFRIQARDKLRNATSENVGLFSVISDTHPPSITILAPEKDQAFRRNDTLDLMVRVDDYSPVLKVEAALSLGGDAPKFGPYALTFDSGAGRWKAPMRIGGKGFPKPETFDKEIPTFQLIVSAKDGAGHESKTAELPLRFEWENGDKLRWAKDASVLMYHEPCAARKVRAFWLAQTEVTNRQYAGFMQAQGGKYDFARAEYWSPEARERLKGVGHPRSEDWDTEDGGFSSDKLDVPVRGISVYEMLAYARWAGLDLPHRSEWIVAAFWDYENSGERPYPWRGTWPGAGASPVWAGGKPGPTSVTKRVQGPVTGSTPFGLEHMFGNLWEIVLDDASGKPVPVGGGFESPLEWFKASGQTREAPQDQERTRRNLRGELREAAVLWSKFDSNLGFRCIKMSAGGKK